MHHMLGGDPRHLGAELPLPPPHMRKMLDQPAPGQKCVPSLPHPQQPANLHPPPPAQNNKGHLRTVYMRFTNAQSRIGDAHMRKTNTANTTYRYWSTGGTATEGQRHGPPKRRNLARKLHGILQKTIKCQPERHRILKRKSQRQYTRIPRMARKQPKILGRHAPGEIKGT